MDRIVVKQKASLDELESLYRGKYVEFARVATGITGSYELGKDAVHNAFAGCISGIGDYRGDGPVEAWVWRAVMTSALKILRSRQNESDSLPADYLLDCRYGSSFDDGEGVVDTAAVRRAVKRLPEQQRLALFLRYYADLDYREIASVMGVKPGTVGAALHKAHASVQRELGRALTHG